MRYYGPTVQQPPDEASRPAWRQPVCAGRRRGSQAAVLVHGLVYGFAELVCDFGSARHRVSLTQPQARRTGNGGGGALRGGRAVLTSGAAVEVDGYDDTTRR